MAYDKQKVIDIALGEVGNLEKETNANLDSKTGNAGDENFTKYARDLDAIKFFNYPKQGHAWCAIFVAWDFYKAYGKSVALKLLCQPSKGNCGAGCKWVRRYFEDKKQWHTSDPQVGDVIVFYSSDMTTEGHTGLVYKVTKSKVYTVEGNTSGASGVIANGGGVCKKSYSLNYARIAGYGRPAYGDQTEVSTSETKPTEATYTTHTIKKGDTLWGIAKKYLGSGAKYKEIMEFNGMKSAAIRAGKTLKIPNK